MNTLINRSQLLKARREELLKKHRKVGVIMGCIFSLIITLNLFTVGFISWCLWGVSS